MSVYKLSRNVERSIMDFLTYEMTQAFPPWEGIAVEKVFAAIYGGKFPAILVNVVNRPDRRREIGTSSLMKFINIELRIFAENDGMRLDLADWLLEIIMPGIIYNEYEIINNTPIPTPTGRIVILEITANRKELINLENLPKEDKYRHLLGIRARVAITGD